MALFGWCFLAGYRLFAIVWLFIWYYGWCVCLADTVGFCVRLVCWVGLRVGFVC